MLTVIFYSKVKNNQSDVTDENYFVKRSKKSHKSEEGGGHLRISFGIY